MYRSQPPIPPEAEVGINFIEATADCTSSSQVSIVPIITQNDKIVPGERSRKHNDVVYVSTYDQHRPPKPETIRDIFRRPKSNLTDNESTYRADSGFSDDDKPKGGLFERKGFGSIAFRPITFNPNITGAHPALDRRDPEMRSVHSDRSFSETPAYSFGRSTPASTNASLRAEADFASWFHDDLISDSEEISEMRHFLTAYDLGEYVSILERERLDMSRLVACQKRNNFQIFHFSIMELDDDDLIRLGMPLGPRKKLLAAITRRKIDLQVPGEIHCLAI